MALLHRVARKQQVFTRRSILLTVLMAAPFSVLVARLFYLQVLAGHKYKRLSDENRISLRLLSPQRGDLIDRYGQLIARNRKTFQLIMYPAQVPDARELLETVARIIPLSKAEIDEALDTYKRQSRFVPVTVRNRLSYEEMAKIQVNLPDLPGVDIDEVMVRHYPHKEIACHTVGYVATPPPNVQEESRLFSLPDFRMGRQGLERVLDERLRGQAGRKEVEVDALGREVQEITRTPAIAGENIPISMDMDLERALYKEMGNLNGAAVVLDMHTGGILSSVSKPGFDPNIFVDGVPQNEWDTLRRNNNNPLLNRALQGAYAPGSTFKMLVALAALEEGVGHPKETITCKGHMEFGDRRFHCWKEEGHGDLNLQQSIEQSCDIYFYEIARRIGVDKLAMYAHKFGLGEVAGVELPESKGLIPTKEWKYNRFGRRWQQGETLITGIGQGYTLCTPLQLAVMTARLATGKKIHPSYMTDAPLDMTAIEDVDIQPAHLRLVQEAMHNVVTSPYGTAFSARSRKIDMAGKTGTSQVVSKRWDKDTKLEDIPENERTNALFVGYAPYDAPRVAAAVVMENAGSGTRAAAPLARLAMETALAHLQEKEQS